MPRYFFHTHTEFETIPDEGGMELYGPDQARAIARDTVHAMMQDPSNLEPLLRASLIVVDEAGAVVVEFPFAEAFKTLPQTGGRT
jgi:hypothetical protein